MILYTLFYIIIGFLMYWGVILCLSEIMILNSRGQGFDSDSEDEEEEYIEAVPIAKATLIRSLTV